MLEAGNAREALKILEARSEIALLFTDVGLPGGMNGRQLAEKARDRRPNLKVLFRTAYARNAIVHAGRLDPGWSFSQSRSRKTRSAKNCAKFWMPKRLPPASSWSRMLLPTEYLGEAGLKVDIAVSAAEALNKLHLIPGGVDAVIVDMGLPDRRGEDLVREIRSIYPSLPIIIASGQATAQLRSLFPDLDSISFVAKPYTDEQLRAALRNSGIL